MLPPWWQPASLLANYPFYRCRVYNYSVANTLEQTSGEVIRLIGMEEEEEEEEEEGKGGGGRGPTGVDHSSINLSIYGRN